MLSAVAGALVGVALWPLAMFLLVRVVLPRRRGRIAQRQADLLADVVDPAAMLDGVQADRLVAEIEQPLLQSVDHIVRDVLTEHLAAWESLPSIMQDMTVKQVQVATPSVVARIVDGFRGASLVDVRQVAAGRLGEPPLAARSARMLCRRAAPAALVAGGVAGFGLGFLTTLAPAALAPAALAVVGVACAVVVWLTATVADRGKPVDGYARMLADAVLTPANLIAAVSPGDVEPLVRRSIREAVDDRALLVSPTLSPPAVAAIGRSATARAVDRIEPLTRRADRYLRPALAVESAVGQANPTTWTALRRTVLDQVKWHLVGAGALIGAVAGAVIAAFSHAV